MQAFKRVPINSLCDVVTLTPGTALASAVIRSLIQENFITQAVHGPQQFDLLCDKPDEVTRKNNRCMTDGNQGVIQN
jgi:hypothetical protein